MKTILISAALVLALTLTSCNKDNIVATSPQQNSSGLSIGLSMKKAPAGISRIEGILSRQGYDTLYADFIIFNDSATCEFKNIEAGVWKLQVNAYDSTNKLQYTGSTDINVTAGTVTPVNLTLNPATGSISITVTWAAAAENLISNPSFEFNNQPSLSGWEIKDTAWIHSAREAPQGEGNWCLSISPPFGPAPGGTAQYFITGQDGYLIYNLSFYERNFAPFYWGYVTITQKSRGDIIFNSSINADTVQWTNFKKSFSLYMQPGDTLSITLGSVSLAVKAANPSQSTVDSAAVLFDGISLTKNRQVPVPL